MPVPAAASCAYNLSTADTLKVWTDAIAIFDSLLCDSGKIIFEYDTQGTFATLKKDSVTGKTGPYRYQDTTAALSPSDSIWWRVRFVADTGSGLDTTATIVTITRDSTDTSDYWLYCPDPSFTGFVLTDTIGNSGKLGHVVAIAGDSVKLIGTWPDSTALLAYTTKDTIAYHWKSKSAKAGYTIRSYGCSDSATRYDTITILGPSIAFDSSSWTFRAGIAIAAQNPLSTAMADSITAASLPAGLSIAKTGANMGRISGTPTTVTAATAYEVIVWRKGVKSDSTDVTITVIHNPNRVWLNGGSNGQITGANFTGLDALAETDTLLFDGTSTDEATTTGALSVASIQITDASTAVNVDHATALSNGLALVFGTLDVGATTITSGGTIAISAMATLTCNAAAEFIFSGNDDLHMGAGTFPKVTTNAASTIYDAGTITLLVHNAAGCKTIFGGTGAKTITTGPTTGDVIINTTGSTTFGTLSADSVTLTAGTLAFTGNSLDSIDSYAAINGGTLNSTGDTIVFGDDMLMLAACTHTTSAATKYKYSKDGVRITTGRETQPVTQVFGSCRIDSGCTFARLQFPTTGTDTCLFGKRQKFVFTALDSTDWSHTTGRHYVMSDSATIRDTLDLPGNRGFRRMTWRDQVIAGTDTMRCTRADSCKSLGGNY